MRMIAGPRRRDFLALGGLGAAGVALAGCSGRRRCPPCRIRRTR